VDRTTLLRVIAIGFLLYGIYNALLLPAMLVAPATPILLIGTIAKATLACVAAFGVWTGKRWAPAVVVLTGVVIAVLWLLYGFVLGIVAYLYAVAMAALALVLTIVLASLCRVRIEPNTV
jgi:hypothetical protein